MVRPNYLKEIMGAKLGYFSEGRASIRDAYLGSREKLYNFDYDAKGRIAPEIESWFTAYFIKEVGEAAIFRFYESLDELGFENSFKKQSGMPYRDYVDDFDKWLKNILVNF